MEPVVLVVGKRCVKARTIWPAAGRGKATPHKTRAHRRSDA
jgi:hypothetical protein